MKIVVALGGNALLRRGEPPEAAAQRRNVEVAVAAIAEVAGRHEVIVTHGNGPQVGLLALQTAAYEETSPYPLDILGAESEGMIGYLLEQGLGNATGRPAATLLTQTLVAADDPAFASPTKPIGPVYTREEAERLAAERGWSVAPDGDRWRRVVASPEPLDIVELAAIRLLVDAGVLVICAGGGGIPVVAGEDGHLHGVEAVVDKDLAAALLADRLAADMLVMLTDVEAVFAGWGTPDQRPLDRLTTAEIAAMDFAPGSMGPKMLAASRFAARPPRVAAIGRLDEVGAIVAGTRGTRVTGGGANP